MFCSHCGYQLEDGIRFCPKCGTETEKVNIIAENVEIVEDAEIVEKFPSTFQKVKKKHYIVYILIVLVIGGIVLSSFKQYRNNVKELQAYVEEGLIEEARTKMDSMSNWQVHRGFNKINHDIQLENSTYISKNVFDAIFYEELEEKVSVLYQMDKLNESTIKSIPDLQYCYEEAIRNNELYIVEEYLSFLQEMQIDYDNSIKDKIDHAQEVRSSYEKAKNKYESGNYQDAINICKEIVPDEIDLVYTENVAVLLNDIETAYSNVIEENMQRATENQDYESIYQFVKSGKENDSDNEKYTEIENQYLEGAMKAVKSDISYQEYDSAYSTCKAMIECMPENDKVANLFVETVQEYVKNLVSSESFESAQEILAESLAILPENKILTTLQSQVDNDTWRLVYEAFLADLYTETHTIEFTLYPTSESEIPYLLVITDNEYTFYKYNDNEKSAEMVAYNYFDACISTEGLFFRKEGDVQNGYFSTTTIESWGVYSFDGKEFVSEYILRKINERHYEAFTNKTLSSNDSYLKDNETISESEYNEQIKRIEAAEGMTTYGYSEDNIKAIIYNNLEQ